MRTQGKNRTEENSGLATGECPQATRTPPALTRSYLPSERWVASLCQWCGKGDSHNLPKSTQGRLPLAFLPPCLQSHPGGECQETALQSAEHGEQQEATSANPEAVNF